MKEKLGNLKEISEKEELEKELTVLLERTLKMEDELNSLPY